MNKNKDLKFSSFALRDLSGALNWSACVNMSVQARARTPGASLQPRTPGISAVTASIHTPRIGASAPKLSEKLCV